MPALYKYILFVFLVSIIFAVPSYSATPHAIAGIELGSGIEEYPDFEFSNFLKETVVMDWHGFRKGIISYGICDSPGTIVRLQMKYEDSSKEFFDTLFQRYKEKYGPPTEWKGDSFGIKHIWKWRFTDDEGRKVNMILSHNLQDHNENVGNQVKLYLPEVVEREHLCFIEHCQDIDDPEQRKRKEALKETGWNYLIPQE
jgi:hypothetical protein